MQSSPRPYPEFSTRPERRSGVDRRHRTLLLTLGLRWPGTQPVRRRAGRRATDQLYPSVDLHSPRILAVALAIMVLCCCDALMTIELLSRGAVEANPAMALALQAGTGWFSAIKLLLTATGVVVLVAVSSMRLFRKVPGEAALHGLLLCYLLLIGYELWLAF
jgi:hypothetical protein